MTCEEARGLFSAAHDDELEAAVGEQLRGHLEGCVGCRRERGAYDEDLGELGSYLHDTAARVRPVRPFPQLAVTRRPAPAQWLGWGALAASLLALAVITTRGRAVAPLAADANAAETRPPVLVVARACPWTEASVEEAALMVSYPLAAAECLEHEFELVETAVQQGEPCDETVRLTYRSGPRNLVLEQAPAKVPSCCAGHQVELGDSLGCVESQSVGTSLRWRHHDHDFVLSGDVGLDEALQVAQAIRCSFGEC